jgi:hypothetical protein
MSDRANNENGNCEWFLNELEGLPVGGPTGTTLGEVLTRMPEIARKHAVTCRNCEGALRDFAETRKAMEEMKAGLPEAGPWFTSRVMGAIRAKEEEIEEKREGVWICVRRMAPRMVAFASVLLLLGGSWAIELRRTDQASGPELRQPESMFESAPSTPMNDDLIASTNVEQEP